MLDAKVARDACAENCALLAASRRSYVRQTPQGVCSASEVAPEERWEPVLSWSRWTKVGNAWGVEIRAGRLQHHAGSKMSPRAANVSWAYPLHRDYIDMNERQGAT